MNDNELTLGQRSAPRKQVSQRMAGFTLIEMMIVVIIVGILTTLALPSYQNYLRATQRTSAQGYLAALAQQQLQYFIDNRSYATSPEALGYSTPPSQVSSHYTVAIQLSDDQPQGFVVTATPNGDQAADTCATLSINSAGTKTSSSGTNCW